MPEPHWTGYVGMVTGIIGAITGISGAIMGYISYRKSNSLKSLSLRLELRKSIIDLHQTFSQLNELLGYANKSRQAVSAATGNLRSGRMEQWKNNLEKDKSYLSELVNKLPNTDESYEQLKTEDLEFKLVEIHKLQGELQELTEKYNAAVNADDEERKQIREDMRVRTAPEK